MTTGYPAILVLEGRLAVVIGGGVVGERKVRTLREAGAKVRVVSEDVTEKVRALADAGEIEWTRRRYERGDLAGASVVVAATDDSEVNQTVYEEATAGGIPVNVVDDLERCTFIAPSIVRRGDLLIAVSTGGNAPALAVRIRERLEREFGPEYATFLEITGALREGSRPAGDQGDRAHAWYRVVDSDVLDLIRSGRVDEARTRARALLLGEA